MESYVPNNKLSKLFLASPFFLCFHANNKTGTSLRDTGACFPLPALSTFKIHRRNIEFHFTWNFQEQDASDEYISRCRKGFCTILGHLTLLYVPFFDSCPLSRMNYHTHAGYQTIRTHSPLSSLQPPISRLPFAIVLVPLSLKWKLMHSF